jgi:hypothetical protein
VSDEMPIQLEVGNVVDIAITSDGGVPNPGSGSSAEVMFELLSAQQLP